MRIGLDYRPALLGQSGIPRAVRELARALAQEADVDLRLFGHSWARSAGGDTAPRGARLCRRRLPGRALPWLAALGIGAERLTGGVELFHWTDYVFPPVGRRARVVMTLHDCAFAVDPMFHGRESDQLADRTRRALARADLVVCPTRATAEDAVERLGVPRARLRVVPFGADHGTDPDRAAPIDGERVGCGPFVLMLGTVEPRKNHVRALDAWRSLGPDRPRLVVVGRPGWACEDAVAALQRAVTEQPVSWIVDADDRQVSALLAQASALLYPSRLEGFGFPPLEALARGVAVVCGDTPALREVAGGVAEFCDPLDPDSIAAALRRALDDRSDTARARRRAHAGKFTWRACAGRYADLYREVLAA